MSGNYKELVIDYIEALNQMKNSAAQNMRSKFKELDWFFSMEETLPKNWVEVNFMDITWLITCGVAKKPVYIEDGIPFLSAQNSKPFKPNLNKIKYISNESFKTFTVGGKPEKGDVIYSRVGANIGEACVVPWEFDFAVYVSLTLIKPIHEIVNSDYLVAFLNSRFGLEQANVGAIGSGLKNLNVNNVRKYKIPLPPLPEQQRIVAKLDVLFGHLEQVKTRLANLPQLLKNFRQAILTQAVTGKLTEEWRKGKELDVDVLIKAIKKDIENDFVLKCQKAEENGSRKPKDQRKNKKSDKTDINLHAIPKEWRYERAEDLTYLITDGVHFKPTYVDFGIPFLSVKNVRPFKINPNECKFVSNTDHEEYIRRCNPENEDILYTKVGATYGYAAKVDLDFDFSIYVSLALIKPSRILNSDYLELLFNSPVIFNQAKTRVSGSGVPDLHLIEIRDFKLPIPSEEEQSEIVRRVESLLTKADAIEVKYNTLKAQIEFLPQAILAKAFKGELVEQLPTDGDAKDLLEEIQKLKAEAGNKKVKVKTKSKPKSKKEVNFAERSRHAERNRSIAAEPKAEYKTN